MIQAERGSTFPHLFVTFPPGKLTYDLAEKASHEWGFNCGPAAICAVTGMAPDELRPSCGTFESVRYTNPSLMCEILTRLRLARNLQYKVFAKSADRKLDWPLFGIARVQWEGPWMQPGVPIGARYTYTHWVASALIDKGRIVFDINALHKGAGWVAEKDWAGTLIPWIFAQRVPRATGWHLTHSIEVRL